MIVDTSVVMAILLQEADAAPLCDVLGGARIRLISAASAVEVGMVCLNRRLAMEENAFSVWLREADIAIVPVDEVQVTLAWAAYRRFGKGRHPAGLNYGDCFAYALARSRGLPLFFKGNDFARTDVARVPA